MFATQTDVLTEYDRLAKIFYHYQAVIPSRLRKEALESGARKLGMLQDGIFIFNDEQEMCVLQDYCLYNLPSGGLNLAARYLRDNPPVPGTDEDMVLQAMAGARYTLLGVTGIVPGVGVEGHDLLRNRDLFMVNRGFSLTAHKGAMLAGRLLSMPEFEISTGADLPVFPDTLDAIYHTLESLSRRLDISEDNLDEPEIAAEISTTIIRVCLQAGTSQYMRYDKSSNIAARARRGEPLIPDALPSALPPALPAANYPRNRPCPCGSGMKYKHCCGEQRRW